MACSDRAKEIANSEFGVFADINHVLLDDGEGVLVDNCLYGVS